MNVKEIKGRTDISVGKFLGYALWKQSNGFLDFGSRFWIKLFSY